MSRHAKDKETVRREILEAAIPLFNSRGLKFTMDELAESLSMSKKTIYAQFPDKKALLYALADYCFDFIRDSKDRVMTDRDVPLVDKVRFMLSALTEKYENIDFSRLHVLRDRYPEIYAHVATRLETGWEDTVALLEQGIREGIFRPFSIPIFKLMTESTLEQFFQNDILVRNGMGYKAALDEVVGILMSGIMAAGPEGSHA